ncbi:hypothetical protein ACOME3_003161 [Neoechinorhynchus agilis]
MSRSKLSQETLLDAVQSVLDGSQEKQRKFTETVELIVVLKNFDPKRDKRFAGSIRIPYAPRPRFTVCVLGDEVHCDQAKAVEIPCMTLDDLKKLNKDKKKIKKLVRSYHAFLASDTIIKQIPRVVGPGFNKAGKFPTPISHSENLMEKIEEVKSTIKFQMKREMCLHLAIANVGLNREDIATNINIGINYLASLTKKGWQNIKAIHIKSTMGRPHRIY